MGIYFGNIATITWDNYLFFHISNGFLFAISTQGNLDEWIRQKY